MDLDVQSYNLGHLGIVAGIFDALRIAEVIDRVLPKQGSKNIPYSIIIKAMILNGLGFTHQRLYLFPNFFIDDFYRKAALERYSSRRSQ